MRVSHSALQEGGEFGRRHFTDGRRKFPVLVLAQARDVAVDRHVVRRIGDDQGSLVVVHQLGPGICLQRVAAQECMLTKRPEVALCCDQRSRADDDIVVAGIGAVEVANA